MLLWFYKLQFSTDVVVDVFLMVITVIQVTSKSFVLPEAMFVIYNLFLRESHCFTMNTFFVATNHAQGLWQTCHKSTIMCVFFWDLTLEDVGCTWHWGINMTHLILIPLNPILAGRALLLFAFKHMHILNQSFFTFPKYQKQKY